MKLFSYVVARDYGFAPNPFYGWCTLATCKPRIRSAGTPGDWVIGTGAKSKYDLAGRLIFAMQAEEVLDFNAYWNDRRFKVKRPVLNGSLKQVYGDNIYHKHRGQWVQEDSHHSLESGRANKLNIERDTSVNRVLLARRFVYFGSRSPIIPVRFRQYGPTEEDICCPGVGHRVFSGRLPGAFEKWLETRGEWGLRGMPIEFENHQRTSQSGTVRGTG